MLFSLNFDRHFDILIITSENYMAFVTFFFFRNNDVYEFELYKYSSNTKKKQKKTWPPQAIHVFNCLKPKKNIS